MRGVHDARDEIADLQRLLGAAGIRPPYVLVGHSYGGMLARLFAREHPEETAGVVLVDARGSDATRRQLAIWPRSQAPAAHRAVFKAVQHGVDLASSEALASQVRSLGDTPLAVVTAGRHELYAMLPATQTVRVGTTLKFSMSTLTFEDHTATFGPGDPEHDPGSYLGTLAASFNPPVFAPEAVCPSESPGTTGSLSPTLHGNGFWNSGVMDTSSATPLPNSNSVTFTAPGTYTYYCMIHPFMKGTIVVQ